MKTLRSFVTLALVLILCPDALAQAPTVIKLPEEWRAIQTYDQSRVWIHKRSSAVLSWTIQEPNRSPSSLVQPSSRETRKAENAKREALAKIGFREWTASSREEKVKGTRIVETVKGHYLDSQSKRIAFVERTIETPNGLHQLLYSREAPGALPESEWSPVLSKFEAAEP